METEQLDLDFGREPVLVSPQTRLRAGRRALRRRRLIQGLGGTLAVVALGGVTWAALPGTGTPAEQHFSTAPAVTTNLPVVVPDDCLGSVCLELVPHGMEPLSPADPGGDMALGYRDGRLVRFSSGVDVVKAIEDPTGTGARQSAAVEVIFRGTRFRVALAEGFGWLADEVHETPASSLEQWFAARHALPDSGCAVQIPRENTRVDSPEPGECWVEVDENGRVVPAHGISLTHQSPAVLPPGALPPGVMATGVEFQRDGERWFGVVRQIGDGAFVNTTLVRAADLAPGTSMKAWVADTAPEISTTGIPDGAQPSPYLSLNWWDPATGEFLAPEGATLVRRVDNPLERTAPDNSAGLVYDFRGKRYWALTEVHALPRDTTTGDVRAADDVRAAGVTVTMSEVEAMEVGKDFDTWLAIAIDERQHGQDTP
jgi:hypothetical protein